MAMHVRPYSALKLSAKSDMKLSAMNSLNGRTWKRTSFRDGQGEEQRSQIRRYQEQFRRWIIASSTQDAKDEG
eukprot:608030-Pelagomonas_calceolata.AAC.1